MADVRLSSIRLIAIDIDGTVLQDDHESMSAADRAALLEAVSAGVEIVWATGRAWHGIPDVIKSLQAAHRVITSNGAATRSWPDGRLLRLVPLPTPKALSVLGVAVEQEGHPVVFCDGKANVLAADKDCDAEVFGCDVPVAHRLQQTVVDDLGDLIRANEGLVEKIDFSPAGTTSLAAISARLEAMDVTPSESGLGRVEVTALGVDKGSALRRLCESLGVPASQVMAIGDGSNDIAMLRWAGVGVAMGNAGAIVQGSADVVAPGNREDGVAWAIRHIALGHRPSASS